jgi:glycosyltransferase involved in cell wall biosynthesis
MTVSQSEQLLGLPLVSIITVVFNGEKYLEKTIHSIIKQTYNNIEYIIIDGGSSDGTIEIIKNYEDYITYWISEPDTGMYNALNKGISKSSGSIVAYLNSDDIYYPDAVESAVKIFMLEKETELIFGQMNLINSDGFEIHRYCFPKYNWTVFASMNYSSIGQPSSFWRRTVHEKVGMFDESLRMASDFDFFIKAGTCCVIRRVDTIYSAFRLYSSSLTGSLMDISRIEVASIHNRYLLSSPVHRWLRIPLSIYGDIVFKLYNIRLIILKCTSLLQNRNYMDIDK